MMAEDDEKLDIHDAFGLLFRMTERWLSEPWLPRHDYDHVGPYLRYAAKEIAGSSQLFLDIEKSLKKERVSEWPEKLTKGRLCRVKKAYETIYPSVGDRV